MNAFATLLFLVAGLLFSADTAFAQASKDGAEGDTYWSTECVGPSRSGEVLTCSAVQNILVADTKQLIFQIKVVTPAGKGAPVMQLQGPLNVFLPGGFALSVDGADLAKVGVSNCNQHGCFGAIKLEPTMIAALEHGQNLKIAFLSGPEKSQYVETPLVGFTRAMKAIE